uniref:Uncharacterized protein n=1 Tax=Ixodes ricinus TaxID=34613 RepID=A0A6B0UQK8_IXORI
MRTQFAPGGRRPRLVCLCFGGASLDGLLPRTARPGAVRRSSGRREASRRRRGRHRTFQTPARRGPAPPGCRRSRSREFRSGWAPTGTLCGVPGSRGAGPPQRLAARGATLSPGCKAAPGPPGSR